MDSLNLCHCCLQRPAARDLQTPYSRLGVTETYSVMIEECFVVKLIECGVGRSGICLPCIEHLRDACRFKILVQQCQDKLQTRMESELSLKDEDVVVLGGEDDLYELISLHEEVSLPSGDDASDNISIHEETPSLLCNDDPGKELLPSKQINEQFDQCLDEAAVPTESMTGEECTSPTPVPAGAQQQLALACCVRLERLRDDRAPHDARTTPARSHHEPRPASAEPVLAYCCDMCAQLFTTKPQLIRHLKTHEDPRPCSCHVCKNTFINTLLLDKHLRFHSADRQFVCGECNMRFSNKPNLKQHEKTHRVGKPYKCDKCNKRYKYKIALSNHKITHSDVKPYRCEQCNMQFPSKTSLLCHTASHATEKPYTCEDCNKQFAFERLLILHKRRHTEPWQKYICDECNTQCVDKTKLIRHIKTHDPIKPYACKECGKMYTRKEHLRRHEITHTGELPFECTLCDMRFNRKYSLNSHAEKKHGIKKVKKDTYSNFASIKKPATKQFNCDKCYKRFVHKSNLEIHKKKHGEPKRYNCGVCNKTFATTAHLKRHEMVHTGEKPYKCEECNKCYGSKPPLDNHMTRQHGYIDINELKRKDSLPKRSCGVCNKIFATITLLKRHNLVHTGEKPYKCKECNKGYTSKPPLDNHMRRQHGNINNKELKLKDSLVTSDTQSQEQSFKCKECNQHVSGRDCYEAHKRTHTGEKPYSCEQCNNRFALNSELERHMRIHSDEKSYECEICETIFYDEISLIKHIDTHKARI